MNVRGDFLIIGSGVAGLRAAIALADAGDVIVLTKADPSESNTGYAQGGIAAALGPDDSPELHARDTIAAGDGLCNPQAVEVLVHDGVRYVRELIAWGAFDRGPNGEPALAREAAHSVRRVLHARDATGREIGRVLWTLVASNPRIRVLEDAQATRLLVRDGVCVGAAFTDRTGVEHEAEARATLLATGGAGQVFRETTNPAVATGDGIAMAFLAGARVADLEFVQFHPTALNVEGAPRFLLSEALRGEGARLVNEQGQRFVQNYDPAGDLAPRDVVSRAIAREVQRTGEPVYLTVAHLDPAFVRQRFPTIAAACREAGLDLAVDRIPVSPAAHYIMGGVETDLDGRTSLPGLSAAGEAACTGVHGANRLASNSLLEGLVFGARAAVAMAEGSGRPARPEHGRGEGRPLQPPDVGADLPLDVARGRQIGPPHGPADIPTTFAVRDLMWRCVGLLRDHDGLESAAQTLDGWWRALRAREPQLADHDVPRLTSLVTVGLLIARAALRREESRGAHFRADFPKRDDVHWAKHVGDVLRSDKSQIPNPKSQ